MRKSFYNNRKLRAEELAVILQEVNRAQEEHPKATVYFDTREYEIRITYPLPEDFYRIESIEINKKKFNQ